MESKYFESLYPSDARSEEIDKIIHYIREGNSCQLIGLPGVGRSNIFGLLAYNHAVRKRHFGDMQKHVHFVFMNFSEVRGRSLLDVNKFLFLSLGDSLKERKMTAEYETVNTMLRDSLQANDEFVLFQGLKHAIDFLAIEKKLTIVFLMDRFDEYIPILTTDFFTNLRVLRNRAKYRFSAVFSVNKPLEDTIEGMLLSDFYEFVADHHIFVRLHDQPMADFRLAYLEKVTGKKVEKKYVDEVYELTGGHGKTSGRSFEAILAAQPSHPELDSGSQTKDSIVSLQNDNLAEFLLSQKTIKKALHEIWKVLSPEEQRLLVSRQYKQESAEYLQQVGLLHDQNIGMPLFADFLEQELKEEITVKEPLMYDMETNTIRKGESVLSEQLTASEFKLLALLLKNPETIIDREQIVASVWQDAKSTAGVTDQAIDQLVFRLRKKIEDDPNNPAHIHTIKGRGIKFTP